MKNKKLLFSEARFVFGKPGDKVPAKGSAPTITPATVETAVEKAKRVKRKKDTTKKLSSMKLKMVERSLGFHVLDLEGKVFKVPLDRVNSKQVADTLSAEVLAVLSSKSNEVALNDIKDFMLKVHKFEIKTEEIKALAARVYAGTLLHHAKGNTGFYPNLSAYAKAMKIKDTGVEAELSFHAKGAIKVKITSKDPDFYQKYSKWEKEKAQKDKAKKVAGQGKESVSKPELDRFAKSPLGKIFKRLGGDRDGKGNWLQLMQEGKAPPLAMFIAGLFGYKIGAEMYGGAVDMLPDKFKGRLKTFERRARNSRYSAKSFAKKNARKTPEVGKGAQEVTADLFSDVIKQNSIPSKGLKLGENYSLKKGETLVVDLTGGGQVVLPKGQDKAYVNGELAEPGKIYKNVKITFSNTIPKGTVITGKVVFKKVAPKKKA